MANLIALTTTGQYINPVNILYFYPDVDGTGTHIRFVDGTEIYAKDKTVAQINTLFFP